MMKSASIGHPKVGEPNLLMTVERHATYKILMDWRITHDCRQGG